MVLQKQIEAYILAFIGRTHQTVSLYTVCLQISDDGESVNKIPHTFLVNTETFNETLTKIIETTFSDVKFNGLTADVSGKNTCSTPFLAVYYYPSSPKIIIKISQIIFRLRYFNDNFLY